MFYCIVEEQLEKVDRLDTGSGAVGLQQMILETGIPSHLHCMMEKDFYMMNYENCFPQRHWYYAASKCTLHWWAPSKVLLPPVKCSDDWARDSIQSLVVYV